MPEFLEIEKITAGYDANIVLEQVSLTLPENASMGLLGRNGVGKTTLLATIMGLTRIHAGAVRFKGEDLVGVPVHLRPARGIGYVPQEREIFQSLTVHENLKVGVRPGEWTVQRVYELFPSLHERRTNLGNQLSGGEQQMLAVGRALVSNPTLLLLDEPFEGLAPVMVDLLVDALDRIRKETKLAMILVEHNAEIALEFVDRAVILDRGQVIWAGPSAELQAEPEKLSTLIGLEEGAVAHA